MGRRDAQNTSTSSNSDSGSGNPSSRGRSSRGSQGLCAASRHGRRRAPRGGHGAGRAPGSLSRALNGAFCLDPEALLEAAPGWTGAVTSGHLPGARLMTRRGLAP